MLTTIKIKGCLPTRAYIAMMIFFACFMAYCIRVHMSINVIAMVKHDDSSNSTGNSSNQAECQSNQNTRNETTTEGIELDTGPRYDWGPDVRGMILGSFFWGYTISSLPAGSIAENLGPKRTILIAALVSAVLTILIPLAASYHYVIVIFFRLVIGLVGGCIYPALQTLIAHWSPPDEKGKFTGALLGSSLGTISTWPVAGLIIESWGWKWAFYIPGLFTLLWSALWFYVISDTPDEHPRISEEEKLYISKSLGVNVKKKVGLPPIKDILFSVPFWALTVLQFGNLWGLFFLLTAGPTFMAKVLGFNLSQSGFYAALPYLARMIFGFMFGSVTDVIIKKKWMGTTTIRKSFVIFSHILPGVFLFLQTLTGCDITWSIVLITLSLGMNGASSVTNLQNSQDLAPNYAGTLYGIATCIGGTSGFISPAVVASITNKKNGLHEWHLIFYIGVTVYIACAIVFLIFGSGERQPWNDKTPKEEDVKTKKKEGVDNDAFNDSEIDKNKENTVV